MSADQSELALPATDLAQAALRRARTLLPVAIFNHSLRTYLYGRLLGEHCGLRPDRDYDDELLFLGCVLHDSGLSDEGDGDQRFELDGADLAVRFLADQGVPPDRTDVVWDAVALHTDREIAQRKRPEIALVALGAGFDLGGGPAALPDGYADHVHRTLPRLRAAAVLHDSIVGQALKKPHKAPPFTMAGELVRQATGGTWPAWEQLARSSGWNDYDEPTSA
ncbi:HD domain-containing protein [Streptomyces sp. SP17BM10]|uniref:HD domain-containing protein n=1 Tax=Streptomyces sp. SP17BM10 TaxID=3002530 RepID=UPI002E7A77E2|nr:HD domain-containing protein [Streptomyces sp. SP17BM10]MEE1786040.1 HD domain-containing protein [Streptomyces sp. SP17BM10]